MDLQTVETEQLLASQQPGMHLYVCGLSGFMEPWITVITGRPSTDMRARVKQQRQVLARGG